VRMDSYVTTRESRNLFKIAALDIPTPLTSVLDGDSAIFPTVATVDFGPEVGRRVTCHRCTVPRRLVGI
jgi:hypothetical protein